jgi:hydrogenase maturation protease
MGLSDPPAAASVLVVGLGNDWRRDDGAGIRAARLLRGECPSGVVVKEARGEIAELLDAWQDFETVILIDAASPRSQPGRVHRFDNVAEQPIPGRLLSSPSTHALGLAEALELARALGQLPKRVVVYGIEGENFDSGEGLSDAVEKAVQDVVRSVLEDLRGM